MADDISEPQILQAVEATAHEVIKQQVTTQDYVVLRIAVIGLIIGMVVSLLGSMVLVGQNKDIPDGIIAIGSAAVGSLATMLVRPPS